MKLFLLTFLFCTQIFAQDLSLLFKNEIPAEMYNNPEYYSQLSGALSFRASRNPDLLYYYLEYLNIDSTKPAEKKAIYYLSGKLNNEQNDRRNNWINLQMNKINHASYNERVLESSKNFFRKYIEIRKDVGGVSAEEIPIDKNKLNYYTYKFYKQDPSMVYSPEINYEALRNQYEADLMKDMQASWQRESESAYEASDIIVKHWYLFDNKDFFNQDESNKEGYELVLLHYKNDHQASFSNVLFIDGGYSWNSTFNYDHDYRVNEINHIYKYSKATNSSQINIGAGYLFMIRDHHSFLSHIKVEAHYFTSTGSSGTRDSMNYANLSTVNDERTTRLSTLVTQLAFESFTTYRLDVSVPLYFLTNNFYCEAGVSASYNIIDFNQKYNYSWYYKFEQFTLSGWSQRELHSGRKNNLTDEGKVQEFVILPFINIMFNMPLNLVAKVSTSYKYASINLGYRIQM